MICRRTFLRAAGIPIASLLGLKVGAKAVGRVESFRRGFCVSIPFHDEPIKDFLAEPPNNLLWQIRNFPWRESDDFHAYMIRDVWHRPSFIKPLPASLMETKA